MTAAISTRSATTADAETLDRIALAAEGPDGGTPGAQVPYLRYLVERGRVVVGVVDGSVVGFGASVRTGRATHLADLFVLPQWQGHGVGQQLLGEVLGDDRPRTTFGSDDPRALPLYLRAGMEAYWPDLYLTGDPAALPAVDGLVAADASVETVAELEAAWAGVDREPDLPYWSALPDVRPFVIRRGTRIVGAGLGRARITGTGRWIHGAMAAPDEDGPDVLMTGLRHGLAGSTRGGGCIPGASPLARGLLERGFRIVDRDTFLASDPSVVDPLREIVDTGVL